MPRLFLVSRARADPHPSPQPDIVILSISARFAPRNVAGRHDAIRRPASPSDANWVNVLSAEPRNALEGISARNAEF